MSFTILHTNDFHNRLTPQQIVRLSHLRSVLSKNGLLLDAGDAGGSSNITYRRKGEAILEAMSDIGYDAMTVGNRDFHFTRTGFQCKLRLARFPILCANVFPKQYVIQNCHHNLLEFDSYERFEAQSTRFSDLPVRPYLLFKTDGSLTILILGLTVPMITSSMWERGLSDYLFLDPLETARHLIPTLQTKFHPDLLIVLSHLGIEKDRAMAASIPRIDLIIGGHSHTVLPGGERVGNTLIVQAGSHGRYYGVVEIDSQKSPGVRLQMQARLESL